MTERKVTFVEECDLPWFKKPGYKGGCPKNHFIRIGTLHSKVKNIIIIGPGYEPYIYNWN